MARGDLARGHTPDEGRRRQLRHPRRLLLVQARTTPRRPRLRLAGPAHGPAARGRHRRRPRHPHRLAPPWLGHLHPDTLPRDADGRTEWWGGRQHFSHSSTVYRRHAAAITEALAARYASHPALTLWHINNEYCTYDHGDEAATRFRRWLQDRYGTLDALNTAWGTAFWSQGYGDWAEVAPPRHAHYLRNPSQVLDFRRFTSDMLLECYTAERDIVRRHTPHIPVTTNFMPLWSGQDAWRWAEEEDVVSVDLYPDPRDPFGAQEGALVQDLTRSQARGPWMLMEQAAGAVNWRGVNHPKPRGLNRLWSLQAVARGADAVCYFQWRQSRQGAEKFHSGMVGHAGEHGRTHQEVVQLGADLARLGPHVAGGTVGADIAVLHDWHAWWAADQEARPSTRVDHADVLRAWHRALWRGGLTTDFAHPEDDLTPYGVVVVPQLYALTDAAVDNLLAHVRGGGTLVCGFLTGVADMDDRIRPGGMDARLRELFGIRTLHEWWPLDADESADCDGFRGTLWSEEIEPDGTASETIPYKGGELDGLPAVLRKGSAWYLSTLPEPDALRDLLARVAADAGARPVLDARPADVEAVRRGDLLFLLHHGRDPVTVDVPGTHRELLTDTVVTDRVTLGRYGVAVLRDPEPAS